MIKKYITKALIAVGALVAGGASIGCLFFVVDEPDVPASLIK